MKYIIVLIISFLPLAVWGQTQKPYSQEKKFNNTTVSITQDGTRFPRTFSLKIHYQNTIIAKTDTIYDSVIDTSWVRDLDSDQNPEIMVLTVTAGTSSAKTLHIYEFSDYSLRKRRMPELNSNIRSLYQGKDSFAVNNNQITRTFPVYRTSDPNCCPSGGIVEVTYGLLNNEIKETGYNTRNAQPVTSSAGKSLTLLIKSVRGLPKMDAFSHTDAWMEIYIGNKLISKTKKVQDTASPFFDEKITVPNYKDDPIFLRIYDKDATKDELIGSVSIQSPLSGAYPILFETGNGNIEKRGEIELQFSF